MSTTDKWASDFQKHSDNPPKEGTVLRCYNGEDARLDIELVEGKPPFIYGRAYVPQIVGHELGWFLQPFDANNAHGFKCILLPKAREEALRRLGITTKRIRVKALRVVRYSRTKNSILVEVAEWCPCPLSEQNKADIAKGIEQAKAGELVPLDPEEKAIEHWVETGEVIEPTQEELAAYEQARLDKEIADRPHHAAL